MSQSALPASMSLEACTISGGAVPKQIVAIRMTDGGSSHHGIAEVVVIRCEDGRGCDARTMTINDVLEAMGSENDFFIRSEGDVEHQVIPVNDGGRRCIKASIGGLPVDALLDLPRYG